MALSPNTAKLTVWTHLVNEGSLQAVYSSNNAKAENLSSVCQSFWHFDICHLSHQFPHAALVLIQTVCLIPMSVMRSRTCFFFLILKLTALIVLFAFAELWSVFCFSIMLSHCRVCHGQGFNYHTAQGNIHNSSRKAQKNKAIQFIITCTISLQDKNVVSLSCHFFLWWCYLFKRCSERCNFVSFIFFIFLC